MKHVVYSMHGCAEANFLHHQWLPHLLCLHLELLKRREGFTPLSWNRQGTILTHQPSCTYNEIVTQLETDR